MRLFATNRTRKQLPIIVAFTLGGAVRETSESNGGQKYMKPMPCMAQYKNGQIHNTRPGERTIAATRIRLAPPQMNEPVPILSSSDGSAWLPRACQRHIANSSGKAMMLNSGSIDWYQGIGT